MGQQKRHYWALIGFFVVTLICTFPIALEPGRALMDLGDTLLNSWILAWETHSLLGPDQASFFDTNIFHPHRNTLAYSEFLIPQLIVAAPVILWSGNPILAHNLVLLVSLLTTALGTYLLAFRITRSRSASFAAGLILAFCPFMFSHLVHVQILFAGGIPLTFLFLFRWLESGRTSDAAVLGLLYAIQALANAYYAVYLALFAGAVFLAQVLRRRSWSNRRFWLQLVLAAAIAAALMGPFYLRYIQLQQEMGFQRVLPSPTPPSVYLAAPGINRLYGGTTQFLGNQEGYLFPGLVAFALALIGLYQWAWPQVREGGSEATPLQERSSCWRRFLVVDGLIALSAILLLLLALGWSVDVRVGLVPLRIASMRNPAAILALLIASRIWMQRRWPEHSRPLSLPTSGWTYPVLLLTAFVLSMGTAPYLFLYRWIPGFSSLRAVSRIHVMFMFALAILAAQGMAFLVGRVTGAKRKILAGVLPVLILLEYFSAPLPLVGAPRPDDFPAVQKWLVDQDEELVIVAYPMRIRDDILRLYYSTRQWRTMVNGFSGFIPPLYEELRSRGRFYPKPQTVRDLQDLGIDLVLVDTHRSRDKQRRRQRGALEATEDLEKIGDFDGTLVYRLKPRSARSETRSRRPDNLVRLDPAQLSLEASVNPDSLSKALDGDRRTSWSSPMVPGEWIEIGWDESRTIAALQLDISGSPHGYPRGYRLQTSEDGVRWQTVVQVPEFYPPIADFLRPNDFVLRFDLPPHRARHLRIVQTGENLERTWTVVELSVLFDRP